MNATDYLRRRYPLQLGPITRLRFTEPHISLVAQGMQMVAQRPLMMGMPILVRGAS